MQWTIWREGDGKYHLHRYGVVPRFSPKELVCIMSACSCARAIRAFNRHVGDMARVTA